MPTSLFPTLRRGDSHPVLQVTKSQLARLGLPVGDAESDEFDRTFDSAIREFQQQRGIVCDGVLGPETFSQVELARFRLGDRVLSFDPVRPMRGDDVAELQMRLSRLGMYTERLDFIFGPQTDAAVRDAQQNLGIQPDGIVGPATLHALSGVVRSGSAGTVFALRERVRLTATGASLAGRVFVIEAGTTPRDFTALHLSQEQADAEARISGDIARRVTGRLTALGAAAITADARSDPRLGDELGAAAVVSITQDHSPSPVANGVATYYFGNSVREQGLSPTGRRLSSFIQRELTARTGFTDCRAHAASWDSLSVLRTPKVHVVAGYLSNAEDARRLADDTVRDSMAEAIVVALQRLYLQGEADPETGTLSVTAIAEATGKTHP
ncbi:N-acetylmuramoyl-L-alanine amidase [Brevibacterium sp. 5221]|uniref:N-acetylmuramoyl-L-alanine amidase n=1 Tax=Brevibacterium rongguiense TaxID=2695267 RepID=A0A6N9H9J3_9MICO|nr:peptidoglycan-binding protein [Brevibacterium rongguiense]MYM20184.1 N-acetylmuramoyl-L-alanine amidase [Brevibacterium rongguiense]